MSVENKDRLPKVVGLVLTFNDFQNTIKCLNSVRASDYDCFDVYLVDNCSEYQILQQIKEQNSNLQIISVPENRGYSGGFNYAIKWLISRQIEFDYVWLVTNDLEVACDSLGIQVRLMNENDSIGFLGPETFKRDGCGQHDQWITYLKDDSNPAQISLGEKFETKGLDLIDVEFVVGHCMLIRKSTILEVGLMRDFFLYYEEREWQWRAKKLNWRRCVAPGSLCFHDRDSFGKPLNTFYRIRNLVYFNRILLKEKSLRHFLFFRNLSSEFYGGLRLFFINQYTFKHLAFFIFGFIVGVFRKIPSINRVL